MTTARAKSARETGAIDDDDNDDKGKYSKGDDHDGEDDGDDDSGEDNDDDEVKWWERRVLCFGVILSKIDLGKVIVVLLF